MTIFAYHTNYAASPVNDQRAGTIRVGSDHPEPVRFTRGWDAVLHFAFRNHNQKPFLTSGSTITARFFNTENTEVLARDFVSDPLITGAATLVLNSVATSMFAAGLYVMVIEYTDDHGRVMLAQSTHSLPRHVVEVIDITTVSLNN
jgi:hypothetical protein